MNSIKLLKSSLRYESEEANIQHALQFLSVAINDYPAEYFLQPPYIFLVIFTQKENISGVKCFFFVILRVSKLWWIRKTLIHMILFKSFVI